ncbi:MAG: efflux RND transporter periplasmic adaptor subunit [Gammaproteobacteria bacterium]|nr:efflux RND transporter periplasmic adaptor subunit [Gammaproteobacteria bacterium]MBI5616042.1 efflux RND transporter periplasmic adaptor subunit [Gammaproteobacteria bacterium]
MKHAPSPRRALIPFALAALCCEVLAAEPAAAPAPPPVVAVARAVKPAGGIDLTLPANIEAWQETRVHARIDGYVRRWHADIGDRVEAGQVLVEIDTPEVDQDLARARASAAQATANLELARVSYERWQRLQGRQVVSEQDLDERHATFDARKADLKAAQAAVERLDALQKFKKVLAPFAGTVTLRNVENGSLIAAGGSDTKEIYRIAETARLRIRVRVPQASLRAVANGVEARVLVAEFPDRVFQGKVVRSAGAVDPGSRTLLTEIELANADGALMPGLFAQVKLVPPTGEKTVLVPTNAVKLDGKGAHVVVVDAAQAVHLLPVAIGRNLGIQIEVLSGLDEGATLVLNPPDALKEGMRVEVKAPEKPKV